MELRGYDLRYLITSLVLDADGTSSTGALRTDLLHLGVDLGPDPRRRVYGALRSEVRKGRLRPLGHGRYTIDELPRSTRDRIRRHARNIELAITAGAHCPPRRPWAASPTTSPDASPFRDAPAVAAPTWLDHPAFARHASRRGEAPPAMLDDRSAPRPDRIYDRPDQGEAA